MKFKDVTGIMKKPITTTRYYITLEDEEIEVEKETYEYLMRDFASGGLWMYSEEKGLIKIGTQISLF